MTGCYSPFKKIRALVTSVEESAHVFMLKRRVRRQGDRLPSWIGDPDRQADLQEFMRITCVFYVLACDEAVKNRDKTSRAIASGAARSLASTVVRLGTVFPMPDTLLPAVRMTMHDLPQSFGHFVELVPLLEARLGIDMESTHAFFPYMANALAELYPPEDMGELLKLRAADETAPPDPPPPHPLTLGAVHFEEADLQRANVAAEDALRAGRSKEALDILAPQLALSHAPPGDVGEAYIRAEAELLQTLAPSHRAQLVRAQADLATALARCSDKAAPFDRPVYGDRVSDSLYASISGDLDTLPKDIVDAQERLILAQIALAFVRAEDDQRNSLRIFQGRMWAAYTLVETPTGRVSLNAVPSDLRGRLSVLGWVATESDSTELFQLLAEPVPERRRLGALGLLLLAIKVSESPPAARGREWILRQLVILLADDSDLLLQQAAQSAAAALIEQRGPSLADIGELLLVFEDGAIDGLLATAFPARSLSGEHAARWAQRDPVLFGAAKPLPREVIPAAQDVLQSTRDYRLHVVPTERFVEAVLLQRIWPPTDAGPEVLSRFGGRPNLPPDLEWPRQTAQDGASEPGALQFLAQIDLSALPAFDKRHLLPRRGMLFFFGGVYDLPIQENVPAAWRVLYTERDCRDVPLREPPDDVLRTRVRMENWRDSLPAHDSYDPCPLRFERHLTIQPYPANDAINFPAAQHALREYRLGKQPRERRAPDAGWFEPRHVASALYEMHKRFGSDKEYRVWDSAEAEQHWQRASALRRRLLELPLEAALPQDISTALAELLRDDRQRDAIIHDIVSAPTDWHRVHIATLNTVLTRQAAGANIVDPVDIDAAASLHRNSTFEHMMLGAPMMVDRVDDFPGRICLLQLDSDFAGPGWVWWDEDSLHFLIDPEDLAARRWDKVIVTLNGYH